MNRRRVGWIAALSIPSLWFGAGVMFSAARCIYTPRQKMTPPGSISRTGSFAGVYCYTSEATNLRRYSASDPAIIPFLGTWYLRERSTVQVTQDATSVSLMIVTPDGAEHKQRYEFVAEGGRIENGVLIVRPFQPYNPFGWYRTRRKSTMYKLNDGSLVMTDQHTYTGLACALVPTHERSVVVLTLSPGACVRRSTLE